MREGKRKMTKAHEVIDHFNINDVYGVVEKGDKSKRRSHLAHVVDLSGKFDLGQHTAKDFDVLAVTGFDQLKANLVAMPYPYTYAEIELTSDPSAGDTFRGWGKGKYAVIIRNSSKAIADLRSQSVKNFSEREYDKVPINLPLEEYSSKWYIHVLRFNKKAIENVGVMVTVMTSAIQEGITSEVILDPHEKNPQEFNPLGKKLEPNSKHWRFDNNVIAPKIKQEDSYINMMGAIQAIVNAKGVDIRTVLPSEKLNKKRKKNGKTPLYEHKIVTFGGISSSGNIVGFGMKRASPRQHWRRGHIRTLPSGEKIAIQAMLINGRGFISKEYVNDNEGDKKYEEARQQGKIDG